MVLLGLLLLLLAAAVAAAVLVPGASDALADAGVSAELTDPSTATAFALGAAAAAVGLLGLLVLTGGARRRVSKRKQARLQRRQADAEAATLAEENARLQQQLEQEQARDVTPYPADGAVPQTAAQGTRTGRHGSAHSR